MRIGIIALLIVFAMASAACGSDEEEPTAAPVSPPPPPAVIAPATTPATAPAPASAPAPAAGNEFTVSLKDIGGSGKYTFDPAELSFDVGDTVTFTLASETEFHTFTVGDLDIDEVVDAGETVSFTYTFVKAGTFELICIPHEANGMVGTITVK